MGKFTDAISKVSKIKKKKSKVYINSIKNMIFKDKETSIMVELGSLKILSLIKAMVIIVSTSQDSRHLPKLAAI